ncbi:MAG: hypothetical protein PF569_03930 [Candidatus Woesearchaeota archaeon]|jgi:recombination protein RecA|nr:hypothetical protein [Candidatus Woesearchaeota archaeon]
MDLSKIEKAFKKIEKGSEGSVVDLENYQNIDRVPTRSPELNKILGGTDIKGVPKGRIIALEGENNHGKSLLCYIFGRAFQDASEYVCYLDFEHSFTEDFAIKQGLLTDSDKFRLIRPESLTEGFEIIEQLIEAGVKCIILDSIALAPTQQELDGDHSKQHMAIKARVMAQSLRKIVPMVSDSNTTLFMTNHLMVDPSVMYGSNLVNPGGRAQNYAYAIRLRVRRTGYITQGEEAVGFKMDVKSFKNKTAPPNKVCSLTFMYETGLDTFDDVITLFCGQEVVHKGGGGNYTFNDINDEPVKIRGRVPLIDYFKENEDLFNKFKVDAGLEIPSEEGIKE